MFIVLIWLQNKDGGVVKQKSRHDWIKFGHLEVKPQVLWGFRHKSIIDPYKFLMMGSWPDHQLVCIFLYLLAVTSLTGSMPGLSNEVWYVRYCSET